jgi:hypothetical protein
MKKVFSLMLAVVSLVVGQAQKTIRDANAEVRNVSGFHKIEVSGGINLYLSNGEEAVAVSASDVEVRNRIKTEVKNGVLKIYYDWKTGVKLNLKNISLKAYVSFKDLDGLSASGGSDVKVDGTIKSDKLNLQLSGGSDFNGRVAVGTLKIDQSGGSDCDLNGTAIDLSIDASGGSDFSGYDLVTDNCIYKPAAEVISRLP